MDEALLPAVQKAYDICLWLTARVARFPRQHKFTLGDRLETTALDLILALVEASHASAKDRALYRADRLLDQLRVLLRLGRDMGLVTTRQQEFISAWTDELGRMLGGWFRSARTRAVPASATLGTPPL